MANAREPQRVRRTHTMSVSLLALFICGLFFVFLPSRERRGAMVHV
jgi:hypothetical protein